MPEIAEVRVVANTLKKEILKKRITNIQILYPKIIETPLDEFKRNLTGSSFEDITTNGKWIIFNMGKYSLLSHLRMEGKYFYEDSIADIEKHTHIIFTLDNGKDLRYNDVRKFGRMLLVETKDVNKTKEISKLGYEPDDKRLTPKYLLDKLSKIKKPIKEALLDQTIINGLGNIYANEVLYAAKVNPLRKANTITEEEAKRIIDSSNKIITKAYEMGGSTIRSYTSSLGVIGHYQDELKVHMKDGTPCPICHTNIEKIRIGGRSTYYCPKCQK